MCTKYQGMTGSCEQLFQSAKLATLGEVAAEVAHELNGPLTCILGYAEVLLNETAAGDPQRQDLETIISEARRAREIVRNLLNFAHPTELRRQPVDMNQLLQQVLAMIRHQLEKSRVRIEEDCAPDIGGVVLDEGLMKQVFLNLINNALQAMPQGGTLHLRTARVDGEVAVSISDTGIGISPEDQMRIFDPFFTTKPAGTGLGLSISLGIVQAHGGCIEVESHPGRGSTFTVRLPIGATEKEIAETVPEGLDPGPSGSPPSCGHRVRIETFVRVIREALGRGLSDADLAI